MPRVRIERTTGSGPNAVTYVVELESEGTTFAALQNKARVEMALLTYPNVGLDAGSEDFLQWLREVDWPWAIASASKPLASWLKRVQEAIPGVADSLRRRTSPFNGRRYGGSRRRVHADEDRRAHSPSDRRKRNPKVYVPDKDSTS